MPWNTKLKIIDNSISFNHTKSILKKALLCQQNIENTIEWTIEDYNANKILREKY